MDTIFRGELSTPSGRLLAWVDSLLIDHGLFRLFWTNAAVVVPGRLYRCNHPTPARLARYTRRWGLRSVINLRGGAANGSEALVHEMADRLGLCCIDVPVSSRRARKANLLALCEAFARMPEPALMYCKSGADRTGFAAGIFLLLNGASTKEALAQLSWRFGHFRGSQTGILDTLFLRYAAEAEGRKPFAEWLRDDFDETALAQDFVPKKLISLIGDYLLARE